MLTAKNPPQPMLDAILGLITVVGVLYTGGIARNAYAAKPPLPTMGADTAAKLMARFADAVDNGNVADAQACLDTSTDGVKNFEAFIIKLAQLNGSRKRLLDQIETKYGKDIRAEAVPLVDPTFLGGIASPYAYLKSAAGDDLKEGATVQLPGFKGAGRLVKRGDFWMIDPTQTLEGIAKDAFDADFAHWERLLKAGQQATDVAGSAKELIEKMKEEARK